MNVLCIHSTTLLLYNIIICDNTRKLSHPFQNSAYMCLYLFSQLKKGKILFVQSIFYNSVLKHILHSNMVWCSFKDVLNSHSALSFFSLSGTLICKAMYQKILCFLNGWECTLIKECFGKWAFPANEDFMNDLHDERIFVLL